MAPPQAARADQIAVLVAFGLASLYARRIVPWYGMALAPTLALAASSVPSPLRGGTHAADSATAGEDGRAAPAEAPDNAAVFRAGAGGKVSPTLMNYAVLSIMLFFLIVMAPWTRPYVPAPFSRSYVVEDFDPEEAAQRLCELEPAARPFTNIFFGSYLAWACPRVPTFMDTRFELYPAAMWRDYIRIANGLYDWEERLARYGVDTLFVQKESEFELIAAAKASGRWETLYEDAYAIVMRRR